MASHLVPIDLIHFAGLNRRAATARTAAPAAAAPPKTATPRAAAKPAPAPESKEEMRGRKVENRRWAAVVYSSEFATNPVVEAHLLAKTAHSAAHIKSLLLAIDSDDKAASMADPAVIADRWAAAAKRAGVGESST